MNVARYAGHPPQEFAAACAALDSLNGRSEVIIEEIPAPSRLAPHAHALAAEVRAPEGFGAATGETIEELAAGRLVVLYDPAAPPEWDGSFRLVSYVRAELERELAGEPLITSVAWSWLMEALENQHADFVNEGGTVTRVISESFAGLAAKPATIDLEVRASWTPRLARPEDLVGHVQAWSDMLCTAAGLPPLPDGVSAMPGRRR